MVSYAQVDARKTYLLMAVSAERNVGRMTVSAMEDYAQRFYEEAVRFYGMAAKVVA